MNYAVTQTLNIIVMDGKKIYTIIIRLQFYHLTEKHVTIPTAVAAWSNVEPAASAFWDCKQQVSIFLYCPVLRCVYLHIANKFLQQQKVSIACCGVERLRWADHSSREVLPSVVFLSVIVKCDNEGPLAL
jgi:hypothetical protein